LAMSQVLELFCSSYTIIQYWHSSNCNNRQKQQLVAMVSELVLDLILDQSCHLSNIINNVTIQMNAPLEQFIWSSTVVRERCHIKWLYFTSNATIGGWWLWFSSWSTKEVW
jgi:hypothetical protein